MWLDWILLIVGMLLLIKGADFFVDGSSKIAKAMHIPPLIIGLTLVSMGTSAPEAAVSITAAFKGTADITVGNVVGSNILNIFIILGLASVITATDIKGSVATPCIWNLPSMIWALSIGSVSILRKVSAT